MITDLQLKFKFALIPICLAFMLAFVNSTYSQTQLTQLTPEKFTIENIMSTPFTSGLVGSTEHNIVAWIENKEGARNIWIAEAPDYVGRPITSYDGDNGQELGGLEISPDGKSIIYVKGGAPNRQGEIPNPTSDPLGVDRAIWVVSTDGSAPRKLSDGSSPKISPNGRMVAFINRRQIWSIRLDGTGEARQTFQMRGSPNNITWSPDGNSIAFVSSRGDHSFIGVYNFPYIKFQYLAPSVDRDSAPEWSPDGKHIAFIRIPNVTNFKSYATRRESLPWSIMVANVSTGEAKEIWKADKGNGSIFKSIYMSNQILWDNGDNLVFPWEKDGWVNLYSISAKGGKTELISQGKSEVQFASISPDRKDIIFDSNYGDIDRKHLYRVPVKGGKIKTVTKGNSIEWAAIITPDNSVAYHASTGTLPSHTQVTTKSKTHDLNANWLTPEYPKDDLVEPEQVIFESPDGMKIHGQLFKPKDAKPGDKRPAVLFFHGGSRRQMLLGYHHRGYYHNAYAMNQYFASRGYVVLSVNYRSGIGYGMEFREAMNYGAQGASEYNDVVGAGLYMQSRNDVDPTRIGLWGGSYGGFLTAMGLAKDSGMFAAGVDLHGVHDWNFRQSKYSDLNSRLAKLSFTSSPIAYVDGWRSPVLLIHADDDRNVAFGQTVMLAEALRKRDIYFEQLVFPDEVHGFLLHRNWTAAYKASIDFFERIMVNRK